MRAGNSTPSIAATAWTLRTGVEARKASEAPFTSSSVQAPSSIPGIALRIRSRVIEASTPAEIAVVRRAPSATQKIEEVGGSSTMPSGRTRSASLGAPLPWPAEVASMFAPVGERA